VSAQVSQILWIILVVALLAVVLSGILMVLALRSEDQGIAWAALALFIMCSLAVAISALRLTTAALPSSEPQPPERWNVAEHVGAVSRGSAEERFEAVRHVDRRPASSDQREVGREEGRRA
jgi:hypothetical protein